MWWHCIAGDWSLSMTFELIQNQASLFADDKTLHATDKSLVSSCVSLSGDLDRAANWADMWGTLFSAPKSKHLPIGREGQKSPSVFMKGVPIWQVGTHKHLGLIFNSTLTWNDHITNLYTTCARMTGSLPRLDGSIPSSSMKKKLYSCHSPSHRICLRGMKWRTDSKTPMLTALIFEKTWPLRKRFDYHTLVLLYRIREKLAPDHLFSSLPSLLSSTSGYSLRKHSFRVPFTKKSLNSFLRWAIILWNTLPFDVQSSKSLGMFKSKLKTYLLL